MRRIKAVLAVLQAGQALKNPARWKEAQAWGSLLIALLALAEAFGFGFGVSEDATEAIALALAALANGYVTVGTTKKIGIQPPDDGFGGR